MNTTKKFKVWTDHENLKYFREPHKLNRKQVRLSQMSYLLVIILKLNSVSEVQYKEIISNINNNN